MNRMQISKSFKYSYIYQIFAIFDKFIIIHSIAIFYLLFHFSWIQFHLIYKNFLTSIWILQSLANFYLTLTRVFNIINKDLFDSQKNSIGFDAYSNWNLRIPSIPIAVGGRWRHAQALVRRSGVARRRVARRRVVMKDGGWRERERVTEDRAAETQSHLCGVCVAVSLFFPGRSSWHPSSRISSGTIDIDITHALRIRVRLSFQNRVSIEMHLRFGAYSRERYLKLASLIV